MHHRVTKEGQAMGVNASRLAEIGLKILQHQDLVNLNLAMVRDEMCSTCACMKDSVPNGCLQTQLDFLKSVYEGKKFLCHAPKDGRLCAGWARSRAAYIANPFSKEITDMLDKWEYSPADPE